MVGIELEDELPHTSVDDGTINGVRLFTCPPGRALFVEPEQCQIDRRFQDVKPHPSHSLYESERRATENFGHVDCPIIQGSIPPLSMFQLKLFFPQNISSIPSWISSFHIPYHKFIAHFFFLS